MTSKTPLFLILLAIPCQAADLYPIAGTVINTVSGAPMSRAVVTVFPSGTTREAGEMVTGDDGKFTFSLPEGSYMLRAGTRDFQENYGMHTPSSGLGSAVITGPGRNTANLVFRWFPTGAITGKILDDTGEPAAKTLVQLIRSTVLAGHRMTATFGSFWTDDRGIYRFGRLPAGTYYLAVAGAPWYSRHQEMPMQRTPADMPSAFLPVYYPNTTEMSQAAPIALKSGEEFHADFSLRTTPGTAVKVDLEVPPGTRGTIGITSTGLGGSVQFIVSENIYDWTRQISFSAIPPGRYILRANANNPGALLYAVQPIEVSGPGLDLKVALRPAPSISGKLELTNPAQRPKGSLVVAVVSENGMGNWSSAVKPDGSFLLPAVAPGRYRVFLRGTDGFFASSIRASGTELPNAILDLTDGESATLSIFASGDVGRLKGFAMNGDQAAEGVLVVLAPVVDRGNASPYRGFQTESDGSFDFTHVPAGEYFLFAVADTALEYENPAIVKPWLSQARKIRIDPHGETSEKVAVLTNGN